VTNIPRFLSRVRVNWLSAGGTLRRCLRMRRWRWMRTTLGHFTNRCRSFLGGSAPPMPNCFGLFSNRGFVTFSCNQPKPTQLNYTLQPWHLAHLKEEHAWVWHLRASSSTVPAPCHLASGPAGFGIGTLSTLHKTYTNEF
jgi:hypothetical protein